MSKKVDSLKIDVRSVLITNQKPISVEEFRKQYKQATGQYVPFKDFGYKNELEILQQMPDVVCIRNNYGIPLLTAVTDSKTQHIKALVSKQKPSKGKPITHSRFQTNYYPVAPRFAERPRRPPPGALPADVRFEITKLVNAYKDGISIHNLMLAYKRKYNKELYFQMFGFATLHDLIRANPDVLLATRRDNEDVVFPCITEKEREEARQKQSASLYSNSKFPPSSSVPFSGPPGYPPKKITEDTHCYTTSNVAEKNHTINKFDILCDFPALLPQPECRNVPPSNQVDKEQLCRESLEDTSGISDKMKNDFSKMLEKYPYGIAAQDFPDRYEEVTGLTFDLHSLGYYKLSELIDKLPTIFQRKPVSGSRKDWSIYPASFDFSARQSPNDSSFTIHHVISNIRNILLACPEGVKLQEFMGIYNTNCTDSLDLDALGFDNISFFLQTIADDVPFVFSGSRVNGTAMIHHYKYRENARVSVDKDIVSLKKEVPSDIVRTDHPYSSQDLPEDLSKCIPIFIATVVNPNFLYMQLKGKDTDGQLILLSEDLDLFYRSPESNAYQMKDSDVMVGATCAAIWPHDNHWYRVQIKSIPALDSVEAFYVDYGNQVRIPRTALRYLKQEFMPLPAQAIKVSLANIRPTKGASNWEPLARDYMLSRWQNTPLQAYVIENASPYPILLYDTCGEEEVLINQELVAKGLAESEVPCGGASFNQGYQGNGFAATMPTTTAFNRQSPLLHAAASNCMQAINQSEAYMNLILNSVRENNPILRNLPKDQLLECVVKSILNPCATNQLMNPAGMSNLQQPVDNRTSFQAQRDAFQSTHPSAFVPYSSAQTRNHGQLPQTMNNAACAAEMNGHENSDSDGEVFVDEDDELFSALCDDVDPFVLTKPVRRVKFSGGYKIHIIVVENIPYVSCGDVSSLLWEDKDENLLEKRLKFKELVLPTLVITEEDNEDIFIEMKRYKVKGIQEVNSEVSVLLYPLKNVIDILNIFGHPSRRIREDINIYVRNFNANDPIEDNEDLETEEAEKSETDRDKIRKLCSYDLKAMVELLHYKKLSIIHDLKEGKNESGVDKINRIENLSVVINKRIKEIEELSSGGCEEFAALKMT